MIENVENAGSRSTVACGAAGPRESAEPYPRCISARRTARRIGASATPLRLRTAVCSATVMLAAATTSVRAGEDLPSFPDATSVRCWGDNYSGQCDVPNDLLAATSIAAGGEHTVALLADGSVRCWGRNNYGQCDVPVDLGPVTAVAAGRYHTVAVLADGSVRCWGYNNHGQCDVPFDLGPVTAVAAGGDHTVALLADGSLRCWGANYTGQCDVPVDLLAATSIAAGRYHTVALLADDSVRCWGDNVFGQCDVPVDLGPVQSVAAGGFHTVALLADGNVRCWGDNFFGQCDVPFDLGPVTAVAAGGGHTVALLADGSVRCWGNNGSGQCDVPVDLLTATSIAAGGYHTVAIGAVPDVTVEAGLSIQTAIEAATYGDIIAIAPGTYPEQLDLEGKSITLWGLGGPDEVVVDSTGLPGSTVRTSAMHSQRAQLVGLTLRGGTVGTATPGKGGLVGGGGLYLEDSNLFVYECRIEECAAGVGGGVFAFGGMPRFVKCTIAGNQSDDDGGGVMLEESSASFSQCEFVANTAAGLGGGLYAVRGEPLVERSAFRDNFAGAAGGGVAWYAGSTPMTLRRVAFAANEAKVGGGAAWIRPGYDNLLIDDVVVCGSGTQPIFGEFIEIGPYEVFSLCADCDGNGLPDLAEVMAETTANCNGNLIPDICDIANGVEEDCNGNGIADACEVASGAIPDCNGNGIPDSCDIANGTSEDRNGEFVWENDWTCVEVGNGIPDECEVGFVIPVDLDGVFTSWTLFASAVCRVVDGGVIEVGPGEFAEGSPGYPFSDQAAVFLGDKAITLRSTHGPMSTILTGLDPGNDKPALTVLSAIGGDLTDDLRPKIEGFTIRFGNGGLPLPGTGMPAGGGILLIDSDAIIENCIIELNHAGGGGAIAIKGGAPIIRNCIIRNNFASGPGAGILLIDTDAVIENCVIEGNLASGRGGGIWAIGGNPMVVDTVVDFNDAASQGGGIAWMGSDVVGGRMLIEECEIRDNLAIGGGGIWIKPFVSNLELGGTSLCGNAPNEIEGVYTDLGGNGGCGVGCPGDLNDDGSVNGADLATMLSEWGALGGAADLNVDGVVDGADLTALLAAWGSCE